MTEEEKMLSGRLYLPSDPDLVRRRRLAHHLSQQFSTSKEWHAARRSRILRRLFPHAEEELHLQAPIQIDYGCHTFIGKHCFANFDLTILDCAPITIGNDVFLGPHCTLATPIHPLLPDERRSFRIESTRCPPQYALPITIGNDCWLASCVTVCGGVTIGSGTVIGAGSVVTRDIPAGVFAAGVPCRPIRPLSERDSLAQKEE